MIARGIVVIAILRECSSISIFGVFTVLDGIVLPTALEEELICFRCFRVGIHRIVGILHIPLEWTVELHVIGVIHIVIVVLSIELL